MGAKRQCDRVKLRDLFNIEIFPIALEASFGR
jgi:hypothetical protein